MARAGTWINSHRIAAALIALFVLVAVTASGLGIAKATDQPDFCRTACHEMSPYAQAWEKGPHAGISCVECHVDPSATARVTHKVEALSEVWSHMQGGGTFPQPTPAEVPNERCIRCHEKIIVNDRGFSHADHAKRGDCQDCHSEAGHAVSVSALKAAGVYSGTEPTTTSSATAAVNAGAADLAGHVEVPCSRCHVMSQTECSNCHKPEHETAGPARKEAPCSTCHAPGAEFAFTHPNGTELTCDSCHVKPTDGHSYTGDCSSCHPSAGTSWKFAHTDRAQCGNCHPRPSNHSAGACTTCHKPGPKWAFSHPRVDEGCEKCHARPAAHRPGACTSCHTGGITWSFAHPGSSATCTRCHTQPAGHKGGTCTSCHPRVGASWAFSHPTKNRVCTSCHARPNGHRTGSCTTCHRVAASWSFRHPAGGDCTACHTRPSGHRSGTCTTCHRVGTTWSFRHPAASSTCTRCHTQPAGHRAGACTSCHSVGTSWAFRHPRQTSTCTSCHPRPSGHSAGQCSSCHRAGASWAYAHPASTSCASCHNAPSNHYGSSCASCHSPSRPWTQATFTHARIPGGEHTSRSFACANCHPRGYSSYTCIKCHSTSTGPRDD